MSVQQLRRNWSYWFFLVGGVLFLQVAILVVVAGDSRAVEPSRPNILIILTDDQRAEGTMDLRKSNGEPWMDATISKFKDDGTEFTNGFASQPACCPSRASIFSGRYAQNNYVRENTELARHLDHDLTMQKYLNDTYFTGIFGKFLNEWDINENPPHWDRWSIFGAGGIAAGTNGYCPFAVNEHPGVTQRYPAPGAPADACTSQGHPYSATYLTAEALGFLREAKTGQEPWLLYVAPGNPHETGRTPKDFDVMADSNLGYNATNVPEFTETDAHRERKATPDDPLSTPGDPSGNFNPLNINDKPKWVREWTDGGAIFPKDSMSDGNIAPGLRKQELRSLLSVDDMVESIFQELGAEANNTLAFYLSDNGYMWREHGNATLEHKNDVERKDIPVTPIEGVQADMGWQAWSYNCEKRPSLNPEDNYQGCPPNDRGVGPIDKGKPYTESIRVPFYARWPAHEDWIGGVPEDKVVANIDIAPTVLDAANITVPAEDKPMDGKSLLDPRRPPNEPVLTQSGLGSFSPSRVMPWASLRARDYQYIEYYVVETDEPFFREYYDLVDDPMQLKNLYGGDGKPGGSDDFLNAPTAAATDALSTHLAALRRPSAPAPEAEVVDFEESPESPTHGFQYVSRDGGTFERDSQIDPLFGGANSGKIHRDAGRSKTVAGHYDLHLRDGDELKYSARFYLPPVNTQTGLQPGENLMLMRWETRYGVWIHGTKDRAGVCDDPDNLTLASTGDYGGIVVTPEVVNGIPTGNYLANLVRGHADGSFDEYDARECPIGPSFPIYADRWSQIWVWQFLSKYPSSTDPSTGLPRAGNYVFASDMFGVPQPVIYNNDNGDANTYGRSINRISFGAVDVKSSGAPKAIDLWIDGVGLTVNPANRPKGIDVQTQNGTANPLLCSAPTPKKPDNCDKVIYTFDKPIDPTSLVPAWDGNGTRQVTLVIDGDTGRQNPNSQNDVVVFPDVPALGKVDLGKHDFVGRSPVPFSATSLSMSSDRKTVTATLGGGTVGAAAATGMSTMIWEGYSRIRSEDGVAAGNHTVPPPAVTESGSADREF